MLIVLELLFSIESVNLTDSGGLPGVLGNLYMQLEGWFVCTVLGLILDSWLGIV